MNVAVWNGTLLLAALLCVIGVMASVAARSSKERLLSMGMVVQAVIVMLVATGVVHARSDLPLAAVVLLSLFVLWSLLAPPPTERGKSTKWEGEAPAEPRSDRGFAKTSSAGAAPSPQETTP